MKILVVNTGSSSLKIEWNEIHGDNAQTKRARVSVERIGERAKISFHKSTDEKETRGETLQNVTEAFRLAVRWLKKLPEFSIDAIGHRVVHGGNKFTAPTLLSAEVLAEIEKLNALAPLHNPVALEAVRAAQKEFPNTQQIAVFDTAFHRTIPEVASTYALPRELNERLQIRRFGFHGIAHEAMRNRFCQLTNRDIAKTKLITIQLGNGCSITAIRDGVSVDTSMGFTPSEGLVMGTRAGDIDSGLLTWLAKTENLAPEQLENLLNKKSGLLGLCGFSDMRDVLEAIKQGDARAKLAVEIYCYRVRKYIGAYLAALNGADGIVFGGGVGEHMPFVREKILQEMNWCGIHLDVAANAKVVGVESCISGSKSGLSIWVIPVDEAALIAENCAVVLPSV